MSFVDNRTRAGSSTSLARTRTSSQSSFDGYGNQEASMASSPPPLTTSMNQNRELSDYAKALKQYGKYCTMRLIQIVVQSRTNEKLNVPCKPEQDKTSSSDWFNISVDELGEVSAQIRKTITRFPPEVPNCSVDFLLYTADGETLPLESWTVSMDYTEKNMEWTNEIKSALYMQMGLLLKSAMCASRMTPMQRCYVKRQSADTFIVLYRLTEGPSTIDLGPDATKICLGSLPTPLGAFQLHVCYRTKMEIERSPAMSPTANYDSFHQVSIHSAGATPDSHHGYVGSPVSFCESHFSTSPPSTTANSPFDTVGMAQHSPLSKTSRSRSTSATSEEDKESSSSGATPGSSAPREKTEMERSILKSQNIPKDMPFAGLLALSYTGTLFSLKEEVEEATNHTLTNESDDMNTTHTSQVSSMADTVVPSPSSRSRSTSENTDDGKEKTSDDHFREDREESTLVPLREESPEGNPLGPDSPGSSQRTPEQEQMGQLPIFFTPKTTTMMMINPISRTESDDDSYVKVLSFGSECAIPDPTSSPEGGIRDKKELGELINSCKQPDVLMDFPLETELDLRRIQADLDEFSRQQCVFDEFLNEVKESADGEDNQ